MRMVLRPVGGTILSTMRRYASSGGGLLTVKESPLENVSIFEMNYPKANVLTSEFITSFLDSIKEVCDPDTGHCRGIILTSSVPGIFSGGLDINELFHNQDKERFDKYWSLFQQLFVTLHSLPVPLVTAINGHAAAAGCIVAMASDYRVMARVSPKNQKPLSIGISATLSGFCVPPYVFASMEHTIGFRKTEELMTSGRLLSADEALAYGLVDEVVDNGEEAIVPCLAYMEKLLQLPSPAPYWIVKGYSRSNVLAPLSSAQLRQADSDNFFNMLQDPTVRSVLGKHVSQLGSKGKAV
ncbi:3,2-trans-enoyl-CoA isomerase, mitochondrial [Angomonas deanei]|uniref:Enoyl-CoA hydratase/isomerase, putative n=1 Tax=Angomonas deanei TaxID=59799 RepID=A0A7G2C159_9TRYP|nr:3,2-trans-enoyl-CoA isomerase, mitochondrial [Angomonas deanei]CAD2213450.1 Enoyl-CoA hydratase/isomerase, putative [Angomonas deanei]|eukprot:EPY29007.1 3,2-trans-enoyl-CoA isomerase, mitochondrial [Angomonas deanei]